MVVDLLKKGPQSPEHLERIRGPVPALSGLCSRRLHHRICDAKTRRCHCCPIDAGARRCGRWRRIAGSRSAVGGRLAVPRRWWVSPAMQRGSSARGWKPFRKTSRSTSTRFCHGDVPGLGRICLIPSALQADRWGRTYPVLNAYSGNRKGVWISCRPFRQGASGQENF